MSLLTAFLLIVSWPLSDNSEAKKYVNELHERSRPYFIKSKYDSAKILVNSALTESRKINYTYGEARSLFILGSIADEQNKSSQAIPYLLESIELFGSINDKSSLSAQAEICLGLGRIFREHQSIEEAIGFYKQGAGFALAANNKKSLRKLLYNESIAHRRNGDFTSAIQVLLESMSLIPGDNHIITQRTYNQFGLIYTELEEYDEAKKWFDKMITLESKSNSPEFYRGQAYHNLALLYSRQNNYSMAWKYYRLAAKEKELLGNAEKLFITYQDMAELAGLFGKNMEAEKYANKALALIDKVPNTPDFYSIYKILSQSIAEEDPTSAIAYANQFIAASEAFNNQQKELLDKSDKYKVQLIASNYFNQVKREKQRLKIAWTASCAAAFVFLAFVLAFKLLRIYNYRSPELALSHIKNPQEMHYLLDLFRKEKEEMKNTMKQQK